MTATRVLIVEDERIVALHLQMQLRRLGYEVLAMAAAGEVALQKIVELRPDVVLMDIHIEGALDGIDTAARIPVGMDVPVIYLTAYSDDATIARARATNPFGYLLKPFTERELHAGIQTALERSRADAELRKHERELERRVQERTAALSDALRRLECEMGQRAEAEAALRQAQKLEAVGQLTGGIAHDFNNLLTVVLGGLQLIQLEPANLARVERLTRSAIGAVERASRLIQQLMTFARQQVLFPETLNLNDVLQELEPLLQRGAADVAALELRLEPELEHTHIDVNEFQAALINLVVNARDAVAAHGRPLLQNGGPRITISSANVTLTAEDLQASALGEAALPPGRYVMVAVQDDGIGIPAEVLPRVFEPFFTTKPVGSGSGLGLSQVYGFARAAGGGVVVQSAPGQGTTVRLYLPRAVPVARLRPAAEPEPAAPAERGGGVVLVVEDDPAVLSLAMECLEAAGWTPLAASGAVEALRVLRSEQVLDVLFCDIGIPGTMDGVALAKAARQLRPGLRVLLTSGYRDGGQPRIPPLLDTCFLAKPYFPEELTAKLRAPPMTG
jgi:signal transduction histidine kinase